MTLYHCTHKTYTPGDIIEPGGWGTGLFQIGPHHGCWTREMALEAVRAVYFRDKPSRLYSTFSCESIDTARCYRSAHCQNGSIYEVKIVDEQLPVHKSDFNLVQPLPGLDADMWRIADLYWRYAHRTHVAEWPGVECSEILSSSALKVIRQIASSDCDRE